MKMNITFFDAHTKKGSAIVGSLIKSMFLYWHDVISVKGQPLDRIIISFPCVTWIVLFLALLKIYGIGTSDIANLGLSGM